MSPEQRAAKLYPEGTIDHAIMRGRVARAIRAAENAALERAACLVESEAIGRYGEDRDKILRRAEEIRALKSRAPRARRKS